jgi:glycosyltransferase involved in cell wall biosynthesis
MDLFLKYGITYQHTNTMVQSITNKKYKASNKILFYAGFSFVEWNYSYSMNNALGGSETAVAYLASVFPKSYEIYIGGTVKEEKVDNVTYVNLNTLNNMINNKVIFNTVIVSRYLGFYEIFNKALFYKSYIWAHDTELNSYGTNKTVSDILNDWSPRINGCICQTKWHAELYSSRYPQLSKKLIIINNGILTNLFKDEHTKKPNSFLYTSCTDRGLERLLDLWPTILEHLPDAELVISGYNPFPHNEFEVGLKQIIDKYPNSVKHAGKLKRNELYALMSTSEYWLYPTNWPETSCITALEMLANEVICLYYPIAGLVDTMNNHGKQILPDTEITTLLSLTPNEKTELRKNGKEYALSCSWDKRAKLWCEQIFDKKLWIFYYNADIEILIKHE